jgi:hypothetical protein
VPTDYDALACLSALGSASAGCGGIVIPVQRQPYPWGALRAVDVIHQSADSGRAFAANREIDDLLRNFRRPVRGSPSPVSTIPELGFFRNPRADLIPHQVEDLPARGCRISDRAMIRGLRPPTLAILLVSALALWRRCAVLDTSPAPNAPMIVGRRPLDSAHGPPVLPGLLGQRRFHAHPQQGPETHGPHL